MVKGSDQVWAKGYMLTAAWGRRESGSSAGSSVFRRRRDAEGSGGRMWRKVRMWTPGGVVAMLWGGCDVAFKRGRRNLHVHGARKRGSGRRVREWPQGAQSGTVVVGVTSTLSVSVSVLVGSLRPSVGVGGRIISN